MNLCPAICDAVRDRLKIEGFSVSSPRVNKGSSQPTRALTDVRASAFYTSIDDLVRRVPIINKKEIRALSLAGALNFDKQVHRREALWNSELAIQPEGGLFLQKPARSKGEKVENHPVGFAKDAKLPPLLTKEGSFI